MAVSTFLLQKTFSSDYIFMWTNFISLVVCNAHVWLYVKNSVSDPDPDPFIFQPSDPFK